jgi:hypothetical protein
MRRPIVEPATTSELGPGGIGREVSRHAAYGQVSIHHVQGASHLYGSDFEHRSYVRLSIKRSELHRDLAHDWHFEREPLIEIALSEAQYAAMISAPNRQGVPCTIEHVNGAMVPGLPRRDTTKLYNAEIERKLHDTVRLLEAQRDAIKAGVSKLPKKAQEEVLRPIETAIREIGGNTPFVIRSFGEHMEQTVVNAKIEVNAYATNTIVRAGIAALGLDAPALPIGPAGITDRNTEDRT